MIARMEAAGVVEPPKAGSAEEKSLFDGIVSGRFIQESLVLIANRYFVLVLCLSLLRVVVIWLQCWIVRSRLPQMEIQFRPLLPFFFLNLRRLSFKFESGLQQPNHQTKNTGCGPEQ